MTKKKSKNLTVTLPHELIVEILLRLRVRSLLRFKCVCKSWLSLISDPQFAKSHYDLAAAPTHRLLLRSTNFYMESIDVEASLYDDSDILNLLLPPPSPPSRYEYNVSPLHNRSILGSCRGLILLYQGHGQGQGQVDGELFVWNPSTGFHKRIPGTYDKLTSGSLCGFGYNASTDDYLAVTVYLDDLCEIEYCSCRWGAWDFLDENINCRYKDLGDQFSVGSFLNGALHWLVFSMDKEVPLIITFDLVEMTLSEIPLPRHLIVGTECLIYNLRVMGECLAVCCSVRGCERDEIWVMKEYKVQSSWTNSVVISNYGILHNHFSPICITEDGGIFGSNFRGRLEKLDDKGQLLEHLTYGATEGSYLGNVQSAMYKESLLSLSKFHQGKVETSEDEQQ